MRLSGRGGVDRSRSVRLSRRYGHWDGNGHRYGGRLARAWARARSMVPWLRGLRGLMPGLHGLHGLVDWLFNGLRGLRGLPMSGLELRRLGVRVCNGNAVESPVAALEGRFLALGRVARDGSPDSTLNRKNHLCEGVELHEDTCFGKVTEGRDLKVDAWDEMGRNGTSGLDAGGNAELEG